MKARKALTTALTGMLLLSSATAAHAQAVTATPLPSRDSTWGTVSHISLAIGALSTLLMPRMFYADPEVTAGWKARWHASVLAPVMTITTMTVLNEFVIKDQLKSFRPGCDDSNMGASPCASYGGPSSHAFGAFASLGHGAGVLIFDSTKWSKGKVNGAAVAGHVVIPVLTAALTGISRSVGNYEETSQIIAGGAAGLGFGFLTGMTYALMQRPECGYTGGLICW